MLVSDSSQFILKLNIKIDWFKVQHGNFTLGLSTDAEMAEAPERESYKQHIPDLSRTCLAAW
jgi:hypothetical protein